MGIKGYLTEKSVLEIFDARPGPSTPTRTSAALSRALAEKYNISTKTVQQIWNRKSWTEVTDERYRNSVSAASSTAANGSSTVPTSSTTAEDVH
eukprot:3527242-Rhodomonas_salina.1